MIRLREFRDEDKAEILANPLDDEVDKYPDFDSGPIAFTGLVNGVVAGCGGIRIYPWETVGEVWLMQAKRDSTLAERIELAFLIREKIESWIKQYKLSRVQSYVRTDWPEAVRLVEALGFVREGVLRKYAPGDKDMYLYAKVK